MPPTFGSSGLTFILINIHLTLYPCIINVTNKSTKNKFLTLLRSIFFNFFELYNLKPDKGS